MSTDALIALANPLTCMMKSIDAQRMKAKTLDMCPLKQISPRTEMAKKVCPGLSELFPATRGKISQPCNFLDHICVQCALPNLLWCNCKVVASLATCSLHGMSHVTHSTKFPVSFQLIGTALPRDCRRRLSSLSPLITPLMRIFFRGAMTSYVAYHVPCM